MTTIESMPDVVDGDVVIGPWGHYGFVMRGEMFLSKDRYHPARVRVFLVNADAGLKWLVCEAKAAYTISDVRFTEPFTRDEHYSEMWRDETIKRLIELSPGLWRRTVAAQLIGAYMRLACADCEEVTC
jgi:hypothetical protein